MSRRDADTAPVARKGGQLREGLGWPATYSPRWGSARFWGLLPLVAVGEVKQSRLVKSALLFSVLFGAVAFAPSPDVAIVALCAVGACSVTFRALSMTFVQLTSDRDMRGRVVALLIVAVNGTTPIGGPLVGWLSEQWGVRAAFVLGSVGTSAAALWLYAHLRRSRDRIPDSWRVRRTAGV